MDKPINIVDYAQRVCMGPGSVSEAEHRALRDITQPVYGSLAWRTAIGLVESRMEGAKENLDIVKAHGVDVQYWQGRYDGLVACLAAMKERGEP